MFLDFAKRNCFQFSIKKDAKIVDDTLDQLIESDQEVKTGSEPVNEQKDKSGQELSRKTDDSKSSKIFQLVRQELKEMKTSTEYTWK